MNLPDVLRSHLGYKCLDIQSFVIRPLECTIGKIKDLGLRGVKNNVREVLGQDFENHFYAMSKLLRTVKRCM